jgi:cytoskeletal protein RodZ
MATTLGEKLRQAREERGISVSEVAEQTRISPLYIKSIEEDDYRTLPGGIFNKGFVKSYAKYVGVDEQEALQDYAALLGAQTSSVEDEPKTYRPQVLTDDNASSSGMKTIVLAALIIGLMVAGILALMNYLQNNPGNNVAVANTNTAVNVNQSNVAVVPTPNSTASSAPAMSDLKVEIKAVGEPVSISYTSDGKTASRLLKPDEIINVEPKERLKFSYYKTLAPNVQMSINGKQIALPQAPAPPKRNAIEVEITKDNLASIWQNGKVVFDAPAAPQ